jgi:hypothetical protein
MKEKGGGGRGLGVDFIGLVRVLGLYFHVFIYGGQEIAL